MSPTPLQVVHPPLQSNILDGKPVSHLARNKLDKNKHNFNLLTANVFNFNFTHLKLCLADAIHNFQ